MANIPYPTPISFFFGYLDRASFRDHLELQDDASFGEDGSLSLTKHNVPNSFGSVLNACPIIFDPFDTIITFQIEPSATPEDNIAFFIKTWSLIPPGASGGSLATPSEIFLAVKFSFFDGSLRIAIVGSGVSASSADFEGYLGEKVTAIISSREGDVTVVAVTDTKTFRVRFKLDVESLRKQYVLVGISASSGNCVQNHNVYSWSFNSAPVGDLQ